MIGACRVRPWTPLLCHRSYQISLWGQPVPDLYGFRASSALTRTKVLTCTSQHSLGTDTLAVASGPWPSCIYRTIGDGWQWLTKEPVRSVRCWHLQVVYNEAPPVALEHLLLSLVKWMSFRIEILEMPTRSAQPCKLLETSCVKRLTKNHHSLGWLGYPYWHEPMPSPCPFHAT